MRPREFIIPVVLLGGVAAFVVYQVVDTRGRAAALPASQAVVTPQGATAETLLVTTGDGPANVTVLKSRRPAPVVDTPAVLALLRHEADGTYLREILSEYASLHRWPDRGTPVRVWIDRNVTLPDWNPMFPSMVERAFNEWQEAGFPLRFAIVLDSSAVDMTIRWIERFGATGTTQTIGRAQRFVDEHGWLVSAEITIAIHSSAGLPLEPEKVAGVARHEVGHALGLGHSDAPGDVMYPESRTPIISAADRKTLHLLYRLPPGKPPLP